MNYYYCSNGDFSLLYNILLRKEGMNWPNSHAYIPPEDVDVMYSSRGRSWHKTYLGMRQDYVSAIERYIYGDAVGIPFHCI